MQKLWDTENKPAEFWQDLKPILRFEDIADVIDDYPVRTVAVAVAQDKAVLASVAEAEEKRIASCILVGDEREILETAEEMELPIDRHSIVHVPDDVQAAGKGLALRRRCDQPACRGWRPPELGDLRGTHDPTRMSHPTGSTGDRARDGRTWAGSDRRSPAG